MSPEEFLKINRHNMFVCNHYNRPCLLSYAECVRRQDAIKKQKNAETKGWVRTKGGSSYDYSHCLRCKEGRANRKLVKTPTKPKKKTKSPKVPVERKVETKQCPCGAVFERPEHTTRRDWVQTKYCPKHRSMSGSVRDNDIARIRGAEFLEIAPREGLYATLDSTPQKIPNKINPMQVYQSPHETRNLTARIKRGV